MVVSGSFIASINSQSPGHQPLLDLHIMDPLHAIDTPPRHYSQGLTTITKKKYIYI